jgi:3-deoxy-7-phosphoheptulonate synthase/chorismate mutase
MTAERLKELRSEVDRINRELLRLLSARAKVVSVIGEVQTELQLRSYDPGREAEMLAYLAAENPGPFSSETICHLFKEIFKASLDLKERQTAGRCLYSRQIRPQNTEVVAGPVTFGAAPLLIAGPCSIESAEQITDTARFLSSHGVRVLRGGAYKPRTSPYEFQGLGEPALRFGRAAADAHSMAFVTEVMDTRDVAVVAQSAHMLQVGARNAQNFALLREVGRTPCAVLLKRGFAQTVEEWLYAAEYILAQGNDQVVLCERGIRTFERWTRNTLDLSAAVLAKHATHLPVVVDVSHAAGRRDLLAPLARAALAAGVDGVMVEVHPNPGVALSDAEQQLDFAEFASFLAAIQAFLPGTVPAR